MSVMSDDERDRLWDAWDVDPVEVTAAIARCGDYVHDPDDTDRPGSDTHTNNARRGD